VLAAQVNLVGWPLACGRHGTIPLMSHGDQVRDTSRLPRGHRIAACVVAAMLAVLTVSVAFPAGALAARSAACQPGAGPDLSGRTLTNAEVSRYSGSLRCANLSGADLSGLSLLQIDFTGANLRGANLRDADLTQTTLNGADLSGADLAGAMMGQATARDTDFRDANMSGTSLIQADLTGADLDGARLGGADFTQATFDGTKLAGTTGLTPWSLYLLIAAVLIFILSARKVLARARRQGAPGSRTGVALFGCLVLAFGFHLFAGGIIDEFIGQISGAPVAQACSGPQCPVGVASGPIGLFAGVLVMLIGASLRRGRGMQQRVNIA
jgi:uncharacterized protein YjbI with pentapeptide repeats